MGIRKRTGRLTVGAGIASIGLFTLCLGARAQDACERFAWSVAREKAWFASSDLPVVEAGESLAAVPSEAFSIKLKPAIEAVFELPPERRSRLDRWFGGIVRLPALNRAGIYQVTFSEDAWIDVVQNARYSRAVGSTARSDCPRIRKSVRLDLDAAPLVLQFSGVAAEEIIMAITPTQ